MKLKQVPRSIRLWFILLGLWGGTAITMLLTLFWISGLETALYVLLAYFFAVLGLWYALGKKYRKNLEEWGIIDPKKEKS